MVGNIIGNNIIPDSIADKITGKNNRIALFAVNPTKDSVVMTRQPKKMNEQKAIIQFIIYLGIVQGFWI